MHVSTGDRKISGHGVSLSVLTARYYWPTNFDYGRVPSGLFHAGCSMLPLCAVALLTDAACCQLSFMSRRS
jgi:hypothetical protein